ncbi:MAG: hypothetical protein IKN64_07880 [Desulfovibrio sp.]|nr:hypothetical protein [Desulfovibrio sp.]
MHVTLLKHTIKSSTEYSYVYVLITNRYKIDDIIADQQAGKKNCILWFIT